MNSNPHGEPEPADPENAVRILELELMRQRATRQQAPHRGLRATAFIFFLAVVLGALLAFYYVFYSGGLDEFRARTTPSPSLAPSSPSTP
jgi:hypothetical protein